MTWQLQFGTRRVSAVLFAFILVMSWSIAFLLGSSFWSEPRDKPCPMGSVGEDFGELRRATECERRMNQLLVATCRRVFLSAVNTGTFSASSDLALEVLADNGYDGVVPTCIMNLGGVNSPRLSDALRRLGWRAVPYALRFMADVDVGPEATGRLAVILSDVCGRNVVLAIVSDMMARGSVGLKSLDSALRSLR